MAKAGRPRALDDAKRREICALVSAGAGIRAAAQYVGCSQSTISRETRRDEEFREQLRRAKATNCLTPLQAMRTALHSNWRAAAWMLERTNPDEFGRSYRQTFGRRELNALARDLLAMIRDEVDHPLLRDRILARMQAMLNYAMRHAWDSQRGGSGLNRAMTDFAKMKPAHDGWIDYDYDREIPSESDARQVHGDENIESLEGHDFAISGPLDELLEELSSKIQASTDERAA